jgi:hypothetical protein
MLLFFVEKMGRVVVAFLARARVAQLIRPEETTKGRLRSIFDLFAVSKTIWHFEFVITYLTATRPLL